AQATEPDLTDAARRVRSAQTSLVERTAAADELLAAGERGALMLLNVLASEADRAARDFRADATRLRQGFERRARALLGKRAARGGAARIETLRAEVLARSRNEALTKATIADEIDPRIAELRALPVVDARTVLAETPALREIHERAARTAALLTDLWLVRAHADGVLCATAEGRRLAERRPGFADPRRLAVDLDAELERLAARATPMSERDARTLAANEAIADGVDAEERAGILTLNRTRILVGLPALAIDVALCAAARDHSRDMVERGFFSHESPVPGKRTFGERAARAGTSASAENIAAGHATGEG